MKAEVLQGKYWEYSCILYNLVFYLRNRFMLYCNTLPTALNKNPYFLLMYHSYISNNSYHMNNEQFSIENTSSLRYFHSEYYVTNLALWKVATIQVMLAVLSLFGSPVMNCSTLVGSLRCEEWLEIKRECINPFIVTERFDNKY